MLGFFFFNTSTWRISSGDLCPQGRFLVYTISKMPHVMPQVSVSYESENPISDDNIALVASSRDGIRESPTRAWSFSSSGKLEGLRNNVSFEWSSRTPSEMSKTHLKIQICVTDCLWIVPKKWISQSKRKGIRDHHASSYITIIWKFVFICFRRKKTCLCYGGNRYENISNQSRFRTSFGLDYLFHFGFLYNQNISKNLPLFLYQPFFYNVVSCYLQAFGIKSHQATEKLKHIDTVSASLTTLRKPKYAVGPNGKWNTI